jgi:hypothetical protein
MDISYHVVQLMAYGPNSMLMEMFIFHVNIKWFLTIIIVKVIPAEAETKIGHAITRKSGSWKTKLA